MQKKYQSKGLVLVALSYEPKSKVAPYVKQHKLPYVVGGDADDTKEAFGIDGFPSAFLIDPDGKIAWKGHPNGVEDEIKKLLKDKPPKKGGLFSEKVAGAALKDADKLVKDKKYPQAIEALEQISTDYKGTKSAGKAKAQISKLKGDSAIMEIVRKAEAEKKCKGWIECARALAAYGSKRDALVYYDRIIKDYPEYDFAKVAKRERGSIQAAAELEPKVELVSAKESADEDEDEETDEEESEGEEEKDSDDGD